METHTNTQITCRPCGSGSPQSSSNDCQSRKFSYLCGTKPQVMITFFQNNDKFYVVQSVDALDQSTMRKLIWLFGYALPCYEMEGKFVGRRWEMVSPWSTNAVEIAENMGITIVQRIEQLQRVNDDEEPTYDKMLECVYDGLYASNFTLSQEREGIEHISDIAEYNEREGLALSPDEVDYLNKLSVQLGRALTDSEVFGFSQVNSEHCRHKIFNGRFVIDGKVLPDSLFAMIKRTSKMHPNLLVSAYKDNVAFVKGPEIHQFAPKRADVPDIFEERKIKSVISLKAETHNFPTTVEPFNGAATGTGGEIRDRLGGGRASLPLAGTAVYMTANPWTIAPRKWLYQSPSDILIKASNGASDFGNKFGQPLICGSLLTFEHKEGDRTYGYDKVIMLAGGVGYAAEKDAIKGTPQGGEKIVVAGGDNYRIGMGGGAVSSVNTGNYGNAIELNAVQRANPEMQKRVSNLIRALAEDENNPIISIHDHGAGGHLNALSELVESTGGHIDLDALPVGDPTLSDKEIIGNESQERMGFVIKEEDLPKVQRIAERERAPLYVVGDTTDDKRFVFEEKSGEKPIDLNLEDMFGNCPQTEMHDSTITHQYDEVKYDLQNLTQYLLNVLSLEAVGCKDWLTNKVDRSVTGRIARQQCVGELQLPLSDCGVVALDYHGNAGIATSIGHAPQAAMIDSASGSVLSIAEALTNIVGANLAHGLSGVSLSANWMWPCHNEGEDAALYRAVKACSDFACALGINIPTGKDSLSMTQKYPDGTKVLAPGTVIISAASEVSDVKKTVAPVLTNSADSTLYYIDFSSDSLKLGGSAFAQSLGKIGSEAPSIKDVEKFKSAFAAIQQLVKDDLISAIHDVSAGGLITTLLEMLFANQQGGLKFYTDGFRLSGEEDLVKILFSENPAVVIQVSDSNQKQVEFLLDAANIKYFPIACPIEERVIQLTHDDKEYLVNIDEMRRTWYLPSSRLDAIQSGEACAAARLANFSDQPVRYRFVRDFALPSSLSAKKVRAAIIREKGVNGDREMAYALHYAGFEVKDVHMSDLMSGREDLSDVNMIVFCGGFSNSDVLGSAKGWAAGFMWNDKALEALEHFYNRPDTLSLGICNGCQLMIELGLIKPLSASADTPLVQPQSVHMEHNISHKFESAFLSVNVCQSPSIMLKDLAGSALGIWVAHGEGRFTFDKDAADYCVAATYYYPDYPGNPNGSVGAIAALSSPDGRHLAMMPHLERAIFPWQCAYYPQSHKNDICTPWMKAFVSAREWIENSL